MQVGERTCELEKAKAGGERQDQQERDAIAIDRGPPGWERTDDLIKSDSLDGVAYRFFSACAQPFTPPSLRRVLEVPSQIM